MIDFPYLDEICRSTPSKIVLLVVDGLGGLPHPDTDRSELETALTPNLDRLAQMSAAGMTVPVAPGVTPGSGPGHMALFGYDPVKYLMGRGVLEALGIGVDLADDEVAVRGNFCTVDGNGLVVDRRAGRIPTEESAQLVELLDEIEVGGAAISVYPVKDHRFVLVMKGAGLDDDVTETDPQAEGVEPRVATATSPESATTANAANSFVAEARGRLHGRSNANMVTLRGFSSRPDLPDMGEQYSLNPAAIAAYPMYRGLADLIGMKVIPTGETFNEELDILEANFGDHDFFFLHYKPADAAGEDGDFDAKVRALEALDSAVPRLTALVPDALVVAGDHSTPAIMGSHSWHSVPLLIHSALTQRDGISVLSERACATGSIGQIPATSVMLLALANAGKLQKFGP